MTVAAGVVSDSEGAEASLLDGLAAALEANRRLAETVGELREENARLREEIARLVEQDAGRDAELERLRAELAVLQRMLVGRSSERESETFWGRQARGSSAVPADQIRDQQPAGHLGSRSTNAACRLAAQLSAASPKMFRSPHALPADHVAPIIRLDVSG